MSVDPLVDEFNPIAIATAVADEELHLRVPWSDQRGEVEVLTSYSAQGDLMHSFGGVADEALRAEAAQAGDFVDHPIFALW